MFARLKKSGRYDYHQIVENPPDGTKTTQRVICTVGRLVHPENPGPLDQVRDIGLRLKNVFEIAMAKP